MLFRPAMFLRSAPPGGGGGTAAAWLSDDAGLQGDWIGTYGLDGHVIAQENAIDGIVNAADAGYETLGNLPGYVSNWANGGAYYVWSTDGSYTPTSRYLNRPAGAPIASTYYHGTGFNVDFDLSAPATVSLYLLSLETTLRDTGIEVRDRTTSAVLAAERRYAGSALADGIWARYSMSGNIRIVVTNYGSPNAVLSAVMFD